MSFTKKEKEEIAEIVRGVLQAETPSEGEEKPTERHNVSGEWRDKGIKSELTGLTVAPVDLEIVLPDGSRKTHFTFEEVLAATGDLPDGWRLPTRSEWVLLAEEFGNNPEGRLDGNMLRERLGLGLNGWMDSDGDLHRVGNCGFYWSSVVHGAGDGYSMYFDGNGSLYPQLDNTRYSGNSVRCVARF